MATNFFQIQSQANILYGVLDDYLSEEEVKLVKKAHKIADDAHSGQYRKSGEAYISHPLSVALILAELKLDYLCIVAAILHDCIEDTSVTNEDVKNEFHKRIRNHFDESTKLYNDMLNEGIAKESARFVLPQATTTRLYMTGTIRSWMHYIELRSAKGTQKEHMDIANKIKFIFNENCPTIKSAMNWE